jgi:Tol biopolymer transport system component
LTGLRDGAEPTWSPDGRQLAFTRSGPSGTSDIFAVRRDGTGLRRLTRSGRAFAAEWSPGGEEMAFLQRSGERFTVSVTDLERKRVRRIATVTAKVPLVWSPDGRYLAWSDFVEHLGSDHVLVARADGRDGPQPITEGVDPDWR